MWVTVPSVPKSILWNRVRATVGDRSIAHLSIECRAKDQATRPTRLGGHGANGTLFHAVPGSSRAGRPDGVRLRRRLAGAYPPSATDGAAVEFGHGAWGRHGARPGARWAARTAEQPRGEPTPGPRPPSTLERRPGPLRP